MVGSQAGAHCIRLNAASILSDKPYYCPWHCFLCSTPDRDPKSPPFWVYVLLPADKMRTPSRGYPQPRNAFIGTTLGTHTVESNMAPAGWLGHQREAVYIAMRQTERGRTRLLCDRLSGGVLLPFLLLQAIRSCRSPDHPPICAHLGNLPLSPHHIKGVPKY